MANLTASPSAKQKNAEYESILTQIFAEIHLLNARMEQDRAEIDRLKADAARLAAETQCALTRLKAMV